ncbi:MAG: tetratricopeptide repeat protein [Chloroflexi bacterium]|nr:tetratricopeptide repeat protein [Chloroflexota bacterium]
MRKVFFTILIILILALILAGISAWVFPQWLEGLPGSLLTLIGVALAAVVALLSKLPAVRDFFFPKEEAEKPEPTTATSGVQIGDHFRQEGIGTSVIAGEIGQVVIQQERTTEPPPRASGFIPTFPEVYIHRGQIEYDVRQRLRGNGLAAIVGVHAPGGVGKTELAKRAAHELSTQFEDVFWLNVGEKTPSQIVADLAFACGLALEPAYTYSQRVAAVRGFLANRKTLIVLDDVRPVNADQLANYLPPSPPNACLVTSRLRNLAALPVRATYQLDAMTADQAQTLLEEVLTPERVQAESETAERLAKRCCYNPLALDIAARRIRVMEHLATPIAWFADKLEHRLGELKAGDDPHLNLYAVFDISYQDLSAEDRRRFDCLATFAPGGFCPEAVAAVWGDSAERAADAIGRLLDRSLLKPATGLRERYRPHDLLDEYAAEKLRASGEERQAHFAQVEWLLNLFQQHSLDDLSNAPQVADELDNLRFAAEWARTSGEGELLAHLATQPRNWLYNVFRIWEDWKTWLETALTLGLKEAGLKANVLKAIGDVQQFRDERDAALESYAQALALFRAVGDRLGEANVLKAIGDVQQFRKENDAALESYAQALALFRAVGAKLGEANVLQAIGDVQQFRKENDAALESYAQALALFRAVGDRLGEANVLAALSRLEIQMGNLDRAEAQLNLALEIRRAIRDSYGEAADCGNFALALLHAGEKQRAQPYSLRCLELMQQIGEERLIELAENLVRACGE